LILNLKILSAENTELKARITALEARLPPAPAPKRTVEPEGVQIFTPTPKRNFVMPSSADLGRLMEIVLKHSQSAPPLDREEQFFRQFKLAFAALGEIGRQPEINNEFVSHGRYVAFQMAEIAIPRNLFAEILRLIAELRPPPAAAPT
jgi:hypothetical protein